MALCRLLPLFLVSYMLFVLCSSASAASDKVNLSLYYEALCPGCSRFMANSLPKLFSTDLIDIVNLHLVPYGNARKEGNQTICQHGRQECFFNKVEACAIQAWPDLKQHWPFLECIETFVANDTYSEFRTCYNSTGLSEDPISHCYIGGLGDELIEQYRIETESLDPPHEFVPWVVVNDVPLLEKYNDYVKFVCEAYKGTPKPNACQNLLHHPSVLQAEDLSVNQVCPVSRNVPPSGT